MGIILGSGEFRYEVIESFGKLPDHWTFHEVAAVAVDHKAQLYCFTRGKHPVIVFDRDGNFVGRVLSRGFIPGDADGSRAG